MLRRIMFMLAAVTCFVLLFGCGQPNQTAKSTDNVNMLSSNDGAERTRLIKQSESIANEIAKLQGVESSYVMLSNQNAYVAVSLDANEQQRNGMGTNRANDVRNNTKNGIGNVTKNGIESNRINDIGTNTTYGLDNNARNGAGSNATDGILNNGTNGVGNGMTDRTGDNEFLSTQMRSQIEAIVKKKDSTIKNVHISTNPDFVVRMNGYMSDLNSGRAMNEVMHDFNQFVRNMFP